MEVVIRLMVGLFSHERDLRTTPAHPSPPPTPAKPQWSSVDSINSHWLKSEWKERTRHAFSSQEGICWPLPCPSRGIGDSQSFLHLYLDHRSLVSVGKAILLWNCFGNKWEDCPLWGDCRRWRGRERASAGGGVWIPKNKLELPFWLSLTSKLLPICLWSLELTLTGNEDIPCDPVHKRVLRIAEGWCMLAIHV